MSYEETAIVEYLQSNPELGFARREISRRAVKRKVFEEDPRWADAPLDALVARGEVEITKSGLYQIKKSRWKP